MSNMEKIKKIGILGGTFNPIHNGHMELAKNAAGEFDLEKVLIMPNNIPAYKSNESIAEGKHRLNMARIAASDFSFMEASDVELKREGITYTSDTLELLTEKYPNTAWYFIIGGDSLLYFDKWHKPDEILKKASLVVAVREGIDKELLLDKINFLKSKYSYADILMMSTVPVNVSSTEIRESICRGKSISGMVPEGVSDYILQNGLYKKSGE